MKKSISFLFVLLISSVVSAQLSIYTTKIGDFKGPVKMVISSGDQGSTVDYFNIDGFIEKSINGSQDHYIVFDWMDNIVKLKFYRRDNDNFIGERQYSYKKSNDGFEIFLDNKAGYRWDFATSTLYSLDFDGKIIFYMRSENKNDQGYTSVVYVNDKLVSMTKIKTYDPDEYGNYTRIVTRTADGIDHVRNVSYEYYE